VRLALYAVVDFASKDISLPSRPFLSIPFPRASTLYSVLPLLEASGVAVSASLVLAVPTGPHKPVVNLSTCRFALQQERNFEDLGFTRAKMSANDHHRFIVCSLMAGVEREDEWTGFEPHNPLLDVEDNDDPEKGDISQAEFDTAVKALLLNEFSNTLLNKLPDNKPAPIRPVSHSIPIINDTIKTRPRTYPMPDKFKAQWAAHANKFVESGWWLPQALDSACAMFALPKHDRTQACFVVNLKPRNTNTVKMHTPIPDMRSICSTVASHRYRSKLDFKNAFKQIRVIPEDVKHTGIATTLGTFVSHVMQQGDDNAPDTMHRVCYMMFRKCIGCLLDVFYDNVFVYSNTRRAHLHYLRIVLETLWWYRFLLSRTKADICTPKLEVLGAIITDNGILVDPCKRDKVASWPTPRNQKAILHFMGTVQWMADHVPTSHRSLHPLLASPAKSNGISRPRPTAPSSKSSPSFRRSLAPSIGAGLMMARSVSSSSLTLPSRAMEDGSLGQDVTSKSTSPVRFCSAKWNSAQRNYSTTDWELHAVGDCITTFRNHLVGRRFTVVLYTFLSRRTGNSPSSRLGVTFVTGSTSPTLTLIGSSSLGSLTTR
jgi:hypothetical protein